TQGIGDGITQGIGDGITQGIGDGITQGIGDGITTGIGEGITQGIGDGITEGIATGISEGIAEGMEKGFSEGMNKSMKDLNEAFDEYTSPTKKAGHAYAVRGSVAMAAGIAFLVMCGVFGFDSPLLSILFATIAGINLTISMYYLAPH
ncbi:MAG: hypothetical protein GW770_02140, partial [Candidatus Altiarchaeum hamiconexum]|nr:hypothetical protein [Candidatus Altarchaeum hamiconexum]